MNALSSVHKERAERGRKRKETRQERPTFKAAVSASMRATSFSSLFAPAVLRRLPDFCASRPFAVLKARASCLWASSNLCCTLCWRMLTPVSTPSASLADASEPSLFLFGMVECICTKNVVVEGKNKKVVKKHAPGRPRDRSGSAKRGVDPLRIVLPITTSTSTDCHAVQVMPLSQRETCRFLACFVCGTPALSSSLSDSSIHLP